MKCRSPWKKRVVFGAPIIILLIGLISYFIVIPNIYGLLIPIGCIFIDFYDAVDALPALYDAPINSQNIAVIQILGWLWLGIFTISLILMCKQLHSKRAPNAQNAILIKKEPYLMILEVGNALKQIKRKASNREWNTLITSVKYVEEQLSVESDFGYGDSSVIDCENRIARELQSILDGALNIESGDFNENICSLNTSATNIRGLLRRRIEMKKH